MNKRIKNIVTVVLLAAFLFGFGAWAALKPADSLSLSERRRLKQLPAVRMDAVLSGKFIMASTSFFSFAMSFSFSATTVRSFFTLYSCKRFLFCPQNAQKSSISG